MLAAIAGPSGSGKTTVIAGLLEFSQNARPLRSYTTRPRRASDPAGEQQFVSDSEFDELNRQGLFAWTVQPYASPYRYGTRMSDIHAALADEDRIHVAPITVDTIPHLRRAAAAYASELCFIYLMIEDEVELRRRLAADPTRTDVERRIAEAAAENAKAASFRSLVHRVDAAAPPETVLARVIRIINLYA